MACEFLSEITGLVQVELPIAEKVTDKIIQFADTVSDGGPEERDRALDCGAYSILCKAWAQCCYSGAENVISPGPGVNQCRDAVLRALYTITAGNPEIIDEVGWQIIAQSIDKTVSEEAHILALRVIRNVAIHSEDNREAFTWNYGLMEPLISLIMKDTPTSNLLQEWCATMKALVLTDDPRVVYNRAPERKRVISRTKVLSVVAGFVSQQEYAKDDGALNAIVVFLGTMAVNEDVCLLIEAGNVLPGLFKILKGHLHNKTLIRNTVSLLRYLCVDKDVRGKCAGYAFMKAVLEVANYYKKESDVIDVSMSCIAMITLGSACQTNQFITRDGLSLALQLMKDYKIDITILKGICFTLRNILENGGPEGRVKIGASGFLAVLTDLVTTAPDLKEFYLMPILREFSDHVATEEESTEQVVTTAGPPTADADDITPPSNGEESEAVSHPEEDVTDVFGEAAEDHVQ